MVQGNDFFLWMSYHVWVKPTIFGGEALFLGWGVGSPLFEDLVRFEHLFPFVGKMACMELGGAHLPWPLRQVHLPQILPPRSSQIWQVLALRGRAKLQQGLPGTRGGVLSRASFLFFFWPGLADEAKGRV